MAGIHSLTNETANGGFPPSPPESKARQRGEGAEDCQWPDIQGPRRVSCGRLACNRSRVLESEVEVPLSLTVLVCKGFVWRGLDGNRGEAIVRLLPRLMCKTNYQRCDNSKETRTAWLHFLFYYSVPSRPHKTTTCTHSSLGKHLALDPRRLSCADPTPILQTPPPLHLYERVPRFAPIASTSLKRACSQRQNAMAMAIGVSLCSFEAKR